MEFDETQVLSVIPEPTFEATPIAKWQINATELRAPRGYFPVSDLQNFVHHIIDTHGPGAQIRITEGGQYGPTLTCVAEQGSGVPRLDWLNRGE